MSTEPPLSVSVGPRHPLLGRDHDSAAHRRRPEHLEPRNHLMSADAFPGLDLVEVIDDPEPRQGGPAAQHDVRIQRLRVSVDTVAPDFSITSADGASNDPATGPKDSVWLLEPIDRNVAAAVRSVGGAWR